MYTASAAPRRYTARMATAWRDRRVIVAGGTTGFGVVLARRLLAAGCRVLVVGRSSESVRRALETLEGTDATAGGAAPPPPTVRACGVAADLARPGEGSRVVGEALRRLGGVDDLFFCVGRSGRARILDTSPGDLVAAFEVNLLTAVEITRAVADDVSAARGHLVYLGSLAGKLVTPWMGAYCVGKGALAAWVDAVRLEMAPRGAHVLLVSPGPIARAADADTAADPQPGRYADAVANAALPASANRPGGGAPVRAIDPEWLAGRILAACERRAAELVVPRKAAWLAGLIEWCPDAGRRLLGRFVPPR